MAALGTIKGWTLIMEVPQILRYLGRYVHDPEYMLESGVLGRRINQVGQAKLPAAVESLESRRVNSSHFVFGESNVAMYAVAENFHKRHLKSDAEPWIFSTKSKSAVKVNREGPTKIIT